MGFFSKEKNEPEIPTAPTLPELPKSQVSEKKMLPELPSFPLNSKNKNPNQEIIKPATANNISPKGKREDMNIQNDIHILEEPEGESLIPPRPFENPSIPEFPMQLSVADLPRRTLEINPIEEKITREVEPIFVRIDKFQSAQKNFEQIKIKIKEIESIIGKIKDTKSKEEIELKGWAEDIERIKSRLSEIDSSIFDQI
ncbi:MAG: hypothetical protein V1889_00035 [archaeon]